MGGLEIGAYSHCHWTDATRITIVGWEVGKSADLGLDPINLARHAAVDTRKVRACASCAPQLTIPT
jgi:hypothetical protein